MKWWEWSLLSYTKWMMLYGDGLGRLLEIAIDDFYPPPPSVGPVLFTNWALDSVELPVPPTLSLFNDLDEPIIPDRVFLNTVEPGYPDIRVGWGKKAHAWVVAGPGPARGHILLPSFR